MRNNKALGQGSGQERPDGKYIWDIESHPVWMWKEMGGGVKEAQVIQRDRVTFSIWDYSWKNGIGREVSEFHADHVEFMLPVGYVGVLQRQLEMGFCREVQMEVEIMPFIYTLFNDVFTDSGK